MAEIELAERYDRMNTVVAELLKGNNATQIAAITGFQRKEVLELIDDWKQVVHNDNTARERAKEAVSGADQHYAMLIKETERKQEVLVKILKEVTSTCPKCKMDVAKRLSQITGVVEPVVIEEASGS